MEAVAVVEDAERRDHGSAAVLDPQVSRRRLRVAAVHVPVHAVLLHDEDVAAQLEDAVQRRSAQLVEARDSDLRDLAHGLTVPASQGGGALGPRRPPMYAGASMDAEHSPERVLIVDDDPSFLAFIDLRLQLDGE